MESDNLSPHEQISIIENALKQTSMQKTGAVNYYLIWGFTLSTYFSIQFINAHYQSETTSMLANFSNLLFAVGGIFSYVQSRKDDRTETIIPINEKVFLYGWTGASIGLGVICLGFIDNFIEIFCVAILLVFGLVNFIIGGVTGFKPLVIGGALSMLFVIVIPHCTIEYKFLCTGLGVVLSCLIPGFLMKKSTANV